MCNILDNIYLLFVLKDEKLQYLSLSVTIHVISAYKKNFLLINT